MTDYVKQMNEANARFDQSFSNDRDDFVEDCRFAKVVHTYNGPAALIGHRVLEIKAFSHQYAEWLVSALRRGGTDSSGVE